MSQTNVPLQIGLGAAMLLASTFFGRWLTRRNMKKSERELLQHANDFLNSDQKIYKFVITGGPCSGKTTAMEKLQVFLRERGFRVFVAQEAATMMLLNGASFEDFNDPDTSYAFQQFVINTQKTLEDQYYNYAKQTKRNCVILCDRGFMDGSAYMSPESWSRLLKEVGLDPISARDSRYDAVFHLVTAADGAEKFYTLENNFARSESPEQAIKVDKRTQEVWSGHPRHIIVDNRNGRSFEKKLEYLVSALASMVGLPTVGRKCRKFPILEAFDVSQLPNVQIFDVEKVMLLSSEASDFASKRSQGKEMYRFIRKRSQGGFSSFGLTTVKQLETGEKVELKQVISNAVYRVLKATATDTTRNIVTQKRYCFLWEQQSFHIYEYIQPRAGLQILLVQSEGEPNLPPFLKVGPEIQSGELSAYSISKKDSDSFISSLSSKA